MPPGSSVFAAEARAASALSHPNIITVHDIASDDGVDFIVMEYVDGKPLDELIPRKGMRLDQLLRIAVRSPTRWRLRTAAALSTATPSTFRSNWTFLL